MPNKPQRRWGKSRKPSSNGYHVNGSQPSTWLSSHSDSRYSDSRYSDSRYQEDSRYPAGGKLRGQVALVVGEAGDTSKELAIGLAELGADVIFIYSNGADEAADTIARQVETYGRRCLTISGQEQTQQFPQEVIRKIVANFGRLDIFIDCSRQASAANGRAHHDNSKPDASLRNHLFPHMSLMKAALSQILSDKGGE